MPKCRTRPFEVEARQVNSRDHDGLTSLMAWVNSDAGEGRACPLVDPCDDDPDNLFSIAEGAGDLYVVRDGGWVILWPDTRGRPNTRSFGFMEGPDFQELFQPADDIEAAELRRGTAGVEREAVAS